MSKIRKFKLAEGCYMFFCPGCNNGHHFRIGQNSMDPKLATWDFNMNMDKPTLSPSYLTGTPLRDEHSNVIKEFVGYRCHSFIKEGMIQFLSDCHHALKGQTVELPDWDDL